MKTVDYLRAQEALQEAMDRGVQYVVEHDNPKALINIDKLASLRSVQALAVAFGISTTGMAAKVACRTRAVHRYDLTASRDRS